MLAHAGSILTCPRQKKESRFRLSLILLVAYAVDQKPGMNE
jgi:hypothetical protein